MIIEKPGTRYGNWTVLDEEPIRANSRAWKWKCRCICGTERFVLYRSLRRGASKSCGCTAHLARAQRQRIDLAGQRFGRLIALRPAERRGNWNSAYWHVKCDCGKEKIVEGKDLRKGRTQSCGCLRDERVGEAATKPARATVVTKINAGYRAGAKRRNLQFDITKEDVERYIFEDCFYCGSPPANIFLPKRFKNPDVHPEPVFYNGIDRVENDVDYTNDNCVTCCPICNMAKRDMSFKDFISWIRRVYEWQDLYHTSGEAR